MNQTSRKPTASDSSEELIEALKERSEQALKEAYDLFSPLVYGMALKILRNAQEAEEVTQDVFVKVWRGIEDFDSSRSALRGWICVMARSSSLDKLRRRSVRHDQCYGKRVSSDLLRDLGQADEIGEYESRDAIDSSMSKIRPEYRRSLELAYFKGYTQREIAEIMGVSEGTVKSFLRRGLARLREVFRSDD